MVAGRSGAASTTSFNGTQACFGGLARIARAALRPTAPDLIKASALANIARLPDASSGSTTTSPASRPRRSSLPAAKLTNFIAPPSPFSLAAAPYPLGGTQTTDLRSEEHTSELQSLRHLVCRLLLEK